MYHYKESGLDNVWLANGYAWHMTPYGKGLSISDARELHQAIALWLTDKPARLTGKEFRYLRSMLGLAQRSLAAMLGVTEQSVSLWERTGKVTKQGDAALRLLVLEKYNGDGKWSQVIERINMADRMANQQIIFRARARKWTGKLQAQRPEATAPA